MIQFYQIHIYQVVYSSKSFLNLHVYFIPRPKSALFGYLFMITEIQTIQKISLRSSINLSMHPWLQFQMNAYFSFLFVVFMPTPHSKYRALSKLPFVPKPAKPNHCVQPG